MAQQTFEERELTWTEVDGLAVEGDPAGRLVEHDRTDDELRFRPASSRAATAQRPKPGGELLVRERLDEVVVRACVEAGHPVPDGVTRGEHQDRDVGPRRADAAGDLEP